jgi:hypothetical protein
MSDAATADEPAAVSNKPIVKRQLDNISVAVFTRDVSKPDGTTFTAKDFVVQKSWKDKDGKWQDRSISLKSSEVRALRKVLDDAYFASLSHSSDDEE